MSHLPGMSDENISLDQPIMNPSHNLFEADQNTDDGHGERGNIDRPLPDALHFNGSICLGPEDSLADESQPNDAVKDAPDASNVIAAPNAVANNSQTSYSSDVRQRVYSHPLQFRNISSIDPESKTGPLLPPQFPQPLFHPTSAHVEKYKTESLRCYVMDGPREEGEDELDATKRFRLCTKNMGLKHRVQPSNPINISLIPTRSDKDKARRSWEKKLAIASAEHLANLTPGDEKYDWAYATNWQLEARRQDAENTQRRLEAVQILNSNYADLGLPYMF